MLLFHLKANLNLIEMLVIICGFNLFDIWTFGLVSISILMIKSRSRWVRPWPHCISFSFTVSSWFDIYIGHKTNIWLDQFSSKISVINDLKNKKAVHSAPGLVPYTNSQLCQRCRCWPFVHGSHNITSCSFCKSWTLRGKLTIELTSIILTCSEVGVRTRCRSP